MTSLTILTEKDDHNHWGDFVYGERCKEERRPILSNKQIFDQANAGDEMARRIMVEKWEISHWCHRGKLIIGAEKECCAR